MVTDADTIEIAVEDMDSEETAGPRARELRTPQDRARLTVPTDPPMIQGAGYPEAMEQELYTSQPCNIPVIVATADKLLSVNTPHDEREQLERQQRERQQRLQSQHHLLPPNQAPQYTDSGYSSSQEMCDCQMTNQILYCLTCQLLFGQCKCAHPDRRAFCQRCNKRTYCWCRGCTKGEVDTNEGF